ncbi:SusC/RagA family TonB-linked outer membrane protein [Parapedobacter pyrenivorans]|uniref:SusC/RagA family TonB-linked outer membrane protein n=1 Tax=Parapedobacter pyrenivorans TaxID=1305674 RepID=A0A917M2W8_9SPHI|nr:TonB-dependent receptor [Parapedobacter pyrenivorans]GGG73561.1 SusC/RagA family TonB-linked outer membrane protein [Parapedobacter pyrenivorans]
MKKIRMFKSLLLAVLCGLTFSFSLYAQVVVTGTVTSEDNSPISGVSVQVVGTTGGTTTSDNGTYTISVPDANAVLAFSFVGYSSQEITVGTQRVINVTLLGSATELEEAVIVGYGTQKKASVVAAISTMDAAGLRQTPASNIGIALAGRLPGLTAIQRSGVPGGEMMEFYIRGRSTVNGQQPLILVDGVPRDFTALDPREVATISVLKDASATAVYGVRGANGVILITTRRGHSGKPIIDLTAEQTWQAPTRMPQMANAYDYALLRNQVEEQNGRQSIYDDVALEHYRLGNSPDLYPVRDYVGDFMKEGFPMRRLNVNVSGGNDRMRYFTTVGYLFQEGIFKTEKFDEYDYDPTSKANRVNFRSNFDIDINKSLSMFLNVSGYMQKKNDPVVVPNNGAYLDDVNAYSVVIGSLLQTPSNYHNDLTPDGEVLSTPLKGGNINNVPYGMLNRSGFRNTLTNQVTASLGAEQKLDFITDGLSAKVVVSYDATSINQQVRQRTYQLYEARPDPDDPTGVIYQPTGTNTNSSLSDSQNQSQWNMTNIDASFNYSRTFGAHDVTGLLLFNRYQRVINIELPYNYVGYVGRATYGYDNRYLAEVNFGYNGSEQFAPGHKMGFFPSVSAGWVASEEDFIKDGLPWLSYAKLRASYGQVGNDNMNGARFAFLTLWNGSYESQIGNNELAWEKANKSNIGLEMRFFNNFSLEADVFYEKRDNILISATGLVPTGMFGTGGVFVSGILPRVNAGKIENRGFELVGGYQKSFNADTRLDVRVNGAFNRNKVLYLSEVTLPEEYAYNLRSTGYPLGQQWGYKTAGFFNSQAEIDNWYDQSPVGANPKVGDLKYMDINGDGVVSEFDMAPIGAPEMPEWTFGAAFSFQTKGFDISMMWQGVANRSYFLAGQRIWETYNFNEWHKEAWSQERYDAGLPITYPRLDPGSNASKLPSDFWYRDGSYIRLKNAEVGYTLPEGLSKRIGATSVRLYANGLNLLTFDRYPVKYQDPEQNNELMYPVFKAYNFGLNVTF